MPAGRKPAAVVPGGRRGPGGVARHRPGGGRPGGPSPGGAVGGVASLDTGRVVAALAVLARHARLRRQFYGGDLHGWERAVEVVTDHACRFAVPFFFFVSGYLLARSTRGGPVLPR